MHGRRQERLRFLVNKMRSFPRGLGWASFVNITVEERGTDLFCILAPLHRKPAFHFKAIKTRHLRRLANKVHKAMEGDRNEHTILH